MHPHDAERVICAKGACALHPEHAGGSSEIVARARRPCDRPARPGPRDVPCGVARTWRPADVVAGITAPMTAS